MFDKSYLSMDIGSRNIKIVHGGYKKGKIEINEYDIIETPFNSVKDGKLIRAKDIAAAISLSLDKNKIKEKKVILTVTGTSVITRDVTIPKSTNDEIAKMLELDSQQYFPVDLDNYVTDFKVLEDEDNSGNVNNRVFLVAVPQKQVDDYMGLAGLMKLEVAAIDIPANCISKCLYNKNFILNNKAASGSNENSVVIDMGHESATVCIYHNSTLKLSRILLNGGIEIDKHICEEFGMDYREAEEYKISKLKIDSDDLLDLNDEILRRLNETARPAVNDFVNDVSRLFDFYSSRSNSNRMGKILLCGGASRLKGLSRYISNYFNINAEQLKPDEKVIYKGKKGRETFEMDYSMLVSAIGAIVRI